MAAFTKRIRKMEQRKRFARWCDQGVWEQMLVHFADDPNMENGLIDSTIVRAHPCAAGAQNK